jgi:DNA-directed RNA polymerase subunit RPC12/RpoP
MLHLFGKKSSELKQETHREIVCPNCLSKNTTKISVLGVYKHLFHIPFLSGGKLGYSVCTNCNHTFELPKMPMDIKLAYYELKETAKTPIWFYSGLIGIKVLVLVKIFSRYF